MKYRPERPFRRERSCSSTLLECSGWKFRHRSTEIVIRQVPELSKSTHQQNPSMDFSTDRSITMNISRNCRLFQFSRYSETQKTNKSHTHKKASCGILAKDTGNAPDKLLLFSLLVSDKNTQLKKTIRSETE